MQIAVAIMVSVSLLIGCAGNANPVQQETARTEKEVQSTPLGSATQTPAPAATTLSKSKVESPSNTVDRQTVNAIEETLKGYIAAINAYDSQAATSFLAEEYLAQGGADLITALAVVKNLNIKVEYLGLVETVKVLNGILATYRTKSTGSAGNNTVRMVNEKGKWKIAEQIEKKLATKDAPLNVTTSLGRADFTPLEFRFATVSKDGEQAQGQFITLIYSFKNQGKKPLGGIIRGFSFEAKDDKDREWDASLSVSLYRDYGLEYRFDSIGPGFERKQLVTFDVPKDATGLNVLVSITQEDSFTRDDEAGFLKIVVP